MPQPISVDPQELARLAGQIRDHADALRHGHRTSTTAAGDAQPGLVGRSAQSIHGTTQQWETATAELHAVLTSQADALSSAAAAYAVTEDNNRAEVETLDPTNL
ncbi:MAG TPA: WXG100 family type VII secretion target [Mycobacterium sp.]|nr:WXG100 family type VII secretion target [Mycobacterium sp.]